MFGGCGETVGAGELLAPGLAAGVGEPPPVLANSSSSKRFSSGYIGPRFAI
jgi:hypothetical protein